MVQRSNHIATRSDVDCGRFIKGINTVAQVDDLAVEELRKEITQFFWGAMSGSCDDLTDNRLSTAL